MFIVIYIFLYYHISTFTLIILFDITESNLVYIHILAYFFFIGDLDKILL